MATIFESKSVLLLALGTNKAGAVAAVEDDVSESMPASLLRSHPNTVLFLDVQPPRTSGMASLARLRVFSTNSC